MRSPLRLLFVILSLGLLLAIPETAYAYGGPGSVISGIGALLAAVAALFAALFGFVWFPLKRLYQRMTSDDSAPNDTPEDASSRG
jgi:nitrate reductase gamma subunit